MYRKGKDFRKKRHLATFVFVPSGFGEKFPTAEFGMISAETSGWEIVLTALPSFVTLRISQNLGSAEKQKAWMCKIILLA